ncbi:acyltransferase [Pseudonocardia sp. KRD-184]|uniref:acyltransferase family protein n=1 Tax=Pseudonocardia oceani TaxID=2792013 RepID=UPI001C4A39BC|nr:acyltransferase [Pseudonocardia oceani]MBW0095915.1 acyltransferase [Pseudonocardia oceani]MBW0122708.1 acyltransferase [Pseudonocardia oceani]
MTYREPPTAPTVALGPIVPGEAVTEPAPPGRGRFGPTLDRAFDPRSNSVNALRLVLAGLVLFSHTLKLHGGSDPLGRLTGGDVDIGTMAVDGFFALSGFLIVGSYLNSPSTGRYLWRRCLRILPGFWVCLLVTVFVVLPIAQLLTLGTLEGFPLTGEASALSYLVDNSALFIRQFEVDGLLGGEPVNGSLYTLFYEFLCYLGVAALGAVGLLRRRTWPLLVVAGLVWLFVVGQLVTGAGIYEASDTLSIAVRFGAMFLAGAVVHRLAHHIPVGWAGGAVASALLVSAVVLAVQAGGDPQSTLVYVVVAPLAVAYLVLLLGARPELRRIGARRDLSYGLYVYAWPVQILLIVAGASLWPVALFGVGSLVIALGMAWASWTWVEAPALRLKSWSPRRT